MIRIPKKQLFKNYAVPLLICLIPLAGFFVYSAKYQPNFFIVLSAVQFLIIAFLIPFRLQLIRKKAEVTFQKQDITEKINLLQADIARENELIAALEKKIVNYTRLKELTEQLCMTLSVAETTRVLASAIENLFEDKDTVKIVYMFDVETGELGISSSVRGRHRVNLKTKKGDIFDEWVIKKRQPLLIEDTKKDYRFDIERVRPDDDRPIRSLMSVPLVARDKMIGILRIDSSQTNIFRPDNLRFLMTVGDLAAVAFENVRLYERVEDLAIKDSLTGLYLRRHFLERMDNEMSRHLRRKSTLSLLMIDLDEFKNYNDQYGHVAGDIVLKTVARQLNETLEEYNGLVCRFGGEEFAVLLPECPKKKAMAIAEELRERIQKREIILRQKKTGVTVSIGVATFPGQAQIKEELIQLADNAMYTAKNKGRNRVCST